MIRTFIVEIDDSLRGAEVDIDELERKWGAEEVKTGNWKETVKHHHDEEQDFDYYEIRCSECGFAPEKSWHLTQYCPNCGAKMEDEG